ncbi:polygalacturonase PglA [Roseibium sp. Sym1]|uniref:polygalacturonase PglA n=1 Tax=Roseibium sp. Sym1 TaxID=3016006 RepID=UPI0022B3E532|nr:glycoside hydrolase family 28 protein [Roseibium sp. Sym1]
MILSILAVSSRTATVLLAPEGAAYRLAEDLAYSLVATNGTVIRSGTTRTVALHFTGLAPDTPYNLLTARGEVSFRTCACDGLQNLKDLGIDADAEDNAALIQQAIDSLPENGTLVVPPGTYRSGPLFLKSRMTLHLETGAELAAISDWQHWPILPAHDDEGRPLGTWEGLPADSFAALINAIGCSGLSLTGDGTLDGGGDRGDWWSWPKQTRRGARRPRTVFLAHCDNVELSGLTVRNSPSWTIHPFRCTNLRAAALRIQNPPDSPNTDGLNPESCEHVTLTGLHFTVGDDCIAVKAGKREGTRTGHLAPCRNLTISHCMMERGHGAVVLGSEMSGDITDVLIRNCEFSGTDRGLRIKTRRGRGGKVARISMSDVRMDKVATAVSANAFYFCDEDGTSDAVQSRTPSPVDTGTPAIESIRVVNVTATNVQLAAVALLGLPEAPITGFRIENMRVSFDPDALPDVPLMASRVPPCRHETVLCEFAEISGGISLLNEDLCDAD